MKQLIITEDVARAMDFVLDGALKKHGLKAINQVNLLLRQAMAPETENKEA
jgi:hypothetical protein